MYKVLKETLFLQLVQSISVFPFSFLVACFQLDKMEICLPILSKRRAFLYYRFQAAALNFSGGVGRGVKDWKFKSTSQKRYCLSYEVEVASKNLVNLQNHIFEILKAPFF